MRETSIFNRISFKLGMLFSSVFFILLMILIFLLYGVFSNLFVDFVSKDLLIRGSNHAKVLAGDFSREMIQHVISMEKGGTIHVLITDQNQNIIGSSVKPDSEMKKYLHSSTDHKLNAIIDHNWKNDKYLVTISSIGKNRGMVYMFYPSDVLRETVSTLKLLIMIAGIGTVLLGCGLIGFLSRRLAKPLLIMKDATNRMARGKYQQKLSFKGNDEITQLSNSIRRLGEQLQFYEDNRNEFLSAVSHELRTPLTYIRGYSDVLSKGIVKNPEEEREYLRIIHKEAKRVSFLIDDLFDMTKLEMGKFQLEREITDLHAIIERVITTLKPAAEKKGIMLSKSLAAPIPSINIDGKRIEQVVYNLIENAIKYTEAGEVTIRTYLQQKFVVTEIKDTGMGIPEEEIPKIWDRFYRVEKSRARKTGGTGLGLYIAKQIIHSHGGDITVKSTVNQGSAFSILLPVNMSVRS